jgi:hypothetical protein
MTVMEIEAGHHVGQAISPAGSVLPRNSRLRPAALLRRLRGIVWGPSIHALVLMKECGPRIAGSRPDR